MDDFIEAENFTEVEPGKRPIDILGVHCTEGPKVHGAARNVALYFAGRAKDPAPQASTHFVNDDAETIQCVRLKDVAWGAQGGNSNGVHMEIIGRAAFTPMDWDDAYARAMLKRSVTLAAALCLKLNLPPIFLRADELKLGRRGITTHAEISLAWRKSDHTDPGPNFPIVAFAARVAALMADPRFKMNPGLSFL